MPLWFPAPTGELTTAGSDVFHRLPLTRHGHGAYAYTQAHMHTHEMNAYIITLAGPPRGLQRTAGGVAVTPHI